MDNQLEAMYDALAYDMRIYAKCYQHVLSTESFHPRQLYPPLFRFRLTISLGILGSPLARGRNDSNR